ncbi:MAG: Sua5/YciO/YrdC/YwlC family protein, partial [Pyrinomonadaceae bacterium]|nr:Sua5/YciO/YrdC/YwlC family protein [Pyrinomonadaceae bacterium]
NKMFAKSVKSKIKRLRLEIHGVVQGVGFRPFVYSAAEMFDLKGFVGNDSNGVFIEIEGTSANLEKFQQYLQANNPPLSHITSVDFREIEPKFDAKFEIIKSEKNEANFTLISPDISVCEECLHEFNDKNNRRFQYPFINCTNCGPRFTITENIPYDRVNTTMSTFTMCRECQNEYENPLERRFHAEPISCWDCGVQAWFVGRNATVKERVNLANDTLPHGRVSAIEQTQVALKLGEIVAIKGIGGFHLACDAKNNSAVETLRQRKGRVDKPFAVMCKDLETAAKFAEITSAEAEVLTSKERPIVLLKKRESDLSESVAPNNNFIGIMLPYSPLHHLLFTENIEVLVMTSGNFSSRRSLGKTFNSRRFFFAPRPRNSRPMR